MEINYKFRPKLYRFTHKNMNEHEEMEFWELNKWLEEAKLLNIDISWI